jgi:hypothetical protein|tara:strand:- start:32755 stop:33195 length:441 start_codon:yes stop_codon:yes gene_type:complete
MFYSFPDQDGFFAYDVSINAPSTTGTPFMWGFACSGCLADGVITFLTGAIQTFTAEDILLLRGASSGLFGFMGESGKLYDSDGNYFQSYQSGENFSIRGNVFAERHNYFYNEMLVNNNCSRATGTINSFYIVNVGLNDFSLGLSNG